ncbi:DUF2145 domain-containing protein [Xenorhabdus innexi]|uniref:Putative outer membrane protein n=1 Tax=Xenorhabdus innexi TaxID=290109 RepID=A0A1N6MT35_9GAMM|nr:DUF2145 domain-containing protein [Xenorhabdus innexi]PHM30376.1 hypothetical protein Xinn_03310 [Xenorhabdus innexi]SIP71944.1 putative outer membrane protein [Xenorhabdus innexi]
MTLLKPVFLMLLLVASATTGCSSPTECKERPLPTPQEAAQRTSEASKLHNWLSQTDDNVVMLAREGQSMSEYGLTFSHAGYAIRTDDDQWRIYHNLNTCATAESDLWIQGVYEFIDDDLSGHNIATLHFPPELQARIKTVLTDPVLRRMLHSSHYNMVAYPFSLTEQNSNGWILMAFAAANSPSVKSLADGVAWLRSEDYIGSSVQVGYIKRTLLDRFMIHMSTKGQPLSGIITFNSGDSLLGFMSRYSEARMACDHGKFGSSVCIVPLDK